MRIAQIAPLCERVPPKLYGGTERVVFYLTEELVRQGHDVTLFASGDSETSAKLVRCCDMALRLDPSVKEPLLYHVMMLEEVRQRIGQFDVLHFHIDFLHAPLVRDFADRTLTTHHGRLDCPDFVPFYRVFPELPLVSVSRDQRKYLPHANWVGTVHHGLPRDLLPSFPIDWPEPFGLVMIEAMACGTPVIAFRRGSVPEVLADGTSGFIVGTIEEAVAAMLKQHGGFPPTVPSR